MTVRLRRVANDVAAIGAAVADGLMAGGVLPVHQAYSRARSGDGGQPLRSAHRVGDSRGAGSHGFRAVPQAPDLPAAMTAHVVFTAYDADAPASISGRSDGGQVIRGNIGFEAC